MSTISTLKRFQYNTLVSTILREYFNVETDTDLMETLEFDDMLGYWASCNNTTPSVIYDAIDANLDNVARFCIVKEVGSSGGWPDCELNLGNGIVLRMDWVIDED